MSERYGRVGPASAALLSALLTTFPARAATLENTPAAFATELRRLASILATATPQDTAAIAKTVPAVWVVEHEGQRFDVPAVWLRRTLHESGANGARWPAARSDAVERLKAMASEAERLGEATAPADAGSARATLDRVLAAPEFSRMVRQSAMDRLRERLLEMFTRLWQRFGGERLANREIAVFLAWTASLAALALLAAWLVRTLRATGRRAALRMAPAGSPALSARAWARQARAADDAGEAVRCGYRAAIRRLEEEGTWRVDEARTPREYRRLLPPDHARRPAIHDVTARFEEIWYGAREATEEDRRTLLSRLAELECLPAE